MIWIDTPRGVEEALNTLAVKHGLIKRSTNQMTAMVGPPKRVFTIKEERVLRHYFGKDFTWSDIGADGRIILFPKTSKGKASFTYITDEDLKKEILRDRVK